MSYVPPLNAAWRPNQTGPEPADREDRELVRQHAGWGASDLTMLTLTTQMNQVAENSPATVARVQAWLDEIENLELDQAGKIADGTAFLGDVAEYEGPRPGYEPTLTDMRKKADIIEWDTETFAKVKFKAGGGTGSATASVNNRIGELRRRIIEALGLQPPGFDGVTLLERS